MEQRNKIIIVNGRARAGKDSAIEYLRKAAEARGFVTAETSSIDPVREKLTEWGFPVYLKGSKERDLLAEVGDAVEKYNGYRTNYCLDYARLARHTDGLPVAVFIHMRELALIDKLEAKAKAEDFLLVRIRVTGSREIIVNSNAADAGVDNMKYDYTIENNGTLENLQQACSMTFRLVMEDFR